MRPRRNRNRTCPISERLVSKSAIADLDAVALRGSLRSHLRVTDHKCDARSLAANREKRPMRVDAYTHFLPKKFFDKLNEVAGDYKDMGKRIRSLPALFDIDVRKKIVDGHKDYQQILSYPQPPIERFAKTPKDIDEFCKIINDGFVELCAKEKDHFPGWV